MQIFRVIRFDLNCFLKGGESVVVVLKLAGLPAFLHQSLAKGGVAFGKLRRFLDPALSLGDPAVDGRVGFGLDRCQFASGDGPAAMRVSMRAASGKSGGDGEDCDSETDSVHDFALSKRVGPAAWEGD